MSKPILATKTLARIDAAIQADQGNEYRRILGTLIHTAKDAYEVNNHPFRTHLGASLLGRECARDIWLSWRWAVKPNFIGRMLRLFNRGHLEEPRFVAMLMACGHTVWQYDANGNQFRISFARGHAGGSTDSVIEGIIELPPGTHALGEFKTHNDSSFKKLKKDGVRIAKFEHFVQMCLYMKKLGLAVALYLAVNKDTDELYGEIVYLDSITADQFIDRGERLVVLREPPKKISESAGHFKCGMCDKQQACHYGKGIEINCRTCKYSDPLMDDSGLWYCNLHNCTLDKHQQLIGCTGHERFF